MKYNLNETTQRVILHQLCSDGAFCARWCMILKPDFFKAESEARSCIVGIIRKFFSEHWKKPGFSFVETEIQFLSNNVQSLVEEELEEIEEVDHDFTDEELDIVVEEFVKNRSILTAMEMQIELIKERRYEDITVPLQTALRNRAVDSGMDFFSEAVKPLLDVSVTFTDRLPLIFPTINKYSYGGWGKEELWVIMGQEFKSHMLIHFALSGMLHGEDGVYVTFELSKDVILHRLTCLLTGCSLSQSINREPWVLDRLERVKHFIKGNLTVLQYPMHSMTIEEVRNRVATKEAQRGSPFKWVCIDYPSLVLPSKTTNSHMLPLTQISGAIKRWGQEEGKRMVMASQLNREGQAAEKRGRNHVAEAKGVIDNSDAGLSLNGGEQDFKSRSLSIYLFKMRNGVPYKTIPLTWGGDSFRFKETDW